MAGRDIKASEVLKDIRSGMNDSELMQKYKISAKGLNNLFQQLVSQGFSTCAPVRKISMKEIVFDIRRGLSFFQLMQQYQLPPHGLQEVLDQLVDAKAISLSELDRELRLRHESVMPENVRQLRRHRLDFEVPVCLGNILGFRGKVRDVTEKGVGLTGIEAETDETTRIIVLGDELGQIEPFELEAKCRWFQRRDLRSLSGYEITSISPKGLRELRNLIRLAAFGENVQRSL